MHSPPPTPSTRSNGRATRTKDLLVADIEQASGVAHISRKRNIEQAGLITPRDTPRRKDVNHNGQLNGTSAAKVLFPVSKRKRFQVFQDPKSPDAFNDDEKNPFKAPKTKTAIKTQKQRSTSPIGSVTLDERPRTPEQYTEAVIDRKEYPECSRRKTRSMARSPSPRRTDGMTYVFRGKKVFRKYNSAEEAEAAEAIKPKRLFVKEMNAPKLSNPFEDDEEATDEDGFDGLELSTYQNQPLQPTKKTIAASSTARRLF